MQWLEELKALKEDREQVTVDAMKNLLKSSVLIVPHHELEKGTIELKDLLSKVEQWEEKAKHFLSSK